MNNNALLRLLAGSIFWAVIGDWNQTGARAQTNAPVVLYSADFSAPAYDINFTLIGQNGWVGAGSGGNGLVTNFFPDLGQQAFIGFSPPEGTNDTLNVWHPIDFVPPTNTLVHVQFSVLMAIFDSTNQHYDDFRWSIYNTNADRLFSVDFDNSSLTVSYGLDNGAGFVSTGAAFTNSIIYTLLVDMNFTSNLWSATLSGKPLVTAQPMTTVGAPLNLGDIDAVWVVRAPGSPGNNYMVFDNYQVTEITGTPAPPLSPSLDAIGLIHSGSAQGDFLLSLAGQTNVSYAIEASTDLMSWSVLATNRTGSDGTFLFLDSTAPAFSYRFYRARLVGP
ncbi:MAG: hypothetical protein M1608_06565 [Candidatus Omnitrophica bacterium]|nr:hypothetical protein [Candidatus Omnitrophota bacterium]